ncbi:uncharacterized protein [Argopecten irradians]|uniref:uncharacterized protein n=1 Tax=Argopecten irradians TaxID=31199 RepID=UPI0037128FAB
MRNQETNETVDQYVTELRNKARTCEFGTLNDSLIKDRLVCGMQDNAVRERLLRETDLDLTKAVELCRSCGASKTHAQGRREGEKSQQVSLVKEKKKHSGSKPQKYVEKSKTRPGQEKNFKECGRCGYNHHPDKCPAIGQTCSKCRKPDHFAAKCHSKTPTNKHSQHNRRRKGRQVHLIDEDDDDDEDYDEHPLFVQAIENQTVKTKQNGDEKDWFVTVKINNQNKQFKMDTGAQCNVMSQKDYKRLAGTTVTKVTPKKLVTYTGQRIKTVGTTILTCEYKNAFHLLECQIVDHDVTPVIGLQTCKDLNLIQRIETVEKTPILAEYTDVFEGLGKIH